MKRFIVKLRKFVRSHENGVADFLTWCTIVAGIAFGMLLIGTTFNACTNRPATTADYVKQYVDSVDITYIDFNTILPHDTHKFKTSQEEYDFLVEANKFKKECLDLAMEGHDIIESILTDGLDSEMSYTLEDFETALETNGYYDVIHKLDSLIDTIMKINKILQRLNAGKTALVTADTMQYLKFKGIAFERICSNFSHNSSLMGNKRLVNSAGRRIKSKSIKTEIRLV